MVRYLGSISLAGVEYLRVCKFVKAISVADVEMNELVVIPKDLRAYQPATNPLAGAAP